MKCFRCGQGELRVGKKNGKVYAVCDKCGISYTADDLRNIAAHGLPNTNSKKPEKKKGNASKTALIIMGVFLGLFILVGAIAIISGAHDSSKDEKAVSKTEKPKNDTADDKKEENGKTFEAEDAIDDIDVYFTDSVRNDVTGRWKLARVATAKDITEYAKKYHDAYFSSDDEIHAVVNFTLNTTNRLSMLSSDLMDICVTEYVDKEEHDASKLFSGLLLAEYHLTLSTGQIEKIQ